MDAPPVILTARRSYEFDVDAIRLSVLSTPIVQAQVRSALGFQTALTGTPMQTFGPVVGAVPPGVVFDWGSYVSENGVLTAIRFLHFEPTRVVIDVAAQSSQIDGVYRLLREVLDSLRLSVGTPALGEPTAIVDYSELLPRFDFPLEGLLQPAVVAFLKSKLPTDMLSAGFVPGFVFQTIPLDKAYEGAVGSNQYVLQLRAGMKPTDNTYFSAAPLTTELHADYLSDLERLMSRARKRSPSRKGN